MKNKRILSIIILLLILVIAFNSNNANVKATYVNPEKEFRAVWISRYVGDVSTYTSEAAFKTEMNTVFNVMEQYNLNAMIFHIRTHNNALYNSDLNPLASWWSSVNFASFDPLEWLIDECHKRGIEFHAWLNPYRVSNSYNASELPAINPASNQDNLLSYNGNTILNPGLPNVRQFLIDTCLEVIERYDVDAIHFDDYFYINLGANGATSGGTTILNEPDQNTFIQYAGNYNTSSALDKANWRRDQINIFIKDLHDSITEFNVNNNRFVQLGIAPTGIYKNGNGVVTYDSQGKPITTGSQTNGQTHYSTYLFCDSLKWCTEGWIDYILPQSYWAQNHPAAAYSEVMGWWDKVVKNLDVNLYSGIGLYMADLTGNTYGWQTNMNELLDQLTIVSSLENVKGASVYSFKYLKNAYNGDTTKSAQQVLNLGTNCWNQKVLLPEIKSREAINLTSVNNFKVNNKILTWDLLSGAKFYAIYKSVNEVTFSKNELVDVVGSPLSTWTDSSSGDFNYGIIPISYTNTLGTPTMQNQLIIRTDTGSTTGTEVSNNNGAIDGRTIQKGFTRCVFLDDSVTDKSRLNYNWTSSNESVATISVYGTIEALNVGTTIITGVYKNDNQIQGQIEITVYDKYTVRFINWDDSILSTQIVLNGSNAVKPDDPTREGYTFFGWDKGYSNVNSNLDINAIYQINEYNVVFKDYDGTVLSTQTVNYGNSAIPPVITGSEYFIFESWDKDYHNIKNDIEIIAQYREILYSIKALSNNNEGIALVNYNGSSKEMHDGQYGFNATIEAVNNTGEFQFWVADGKIISFNPIHSFTSTKNHVITAYFSSSNKYAVTYVDSNMTMLDYQLVNSGADVTTDKLPSSKPGYTFAGWQEVKNVTNHTIVYAKFTINDELLNVTINNGVFKDSNLTYKAIKYGQLVTVENNDSNFSYWMINNQIVSYSPIYTFSLYQDTEITAITNGSIEKEFMIYLQTPFMDKTTNKVAFYGKFDNPLGFELVEVGIMYVKGVEIDPRNDVNTKKVRILRYSNNNEYCVFFTLQPGETVSAILYAVTNQGEYVYHYSNYQVFTYAEETSNITYYLNGGGFYQYSSREAMINDFINDYNNKFGINTTSSTFFNDTYQQAVYTIFSDVNYGPKWTWLKEYIIKVCEDNNYDNLASLKSGTDNLWRSNLHAFFNKSVYTSWPYSYNFSNDNDNNGFWNRITITPPCSYEIGESYTLPIPYKVGFTFAGYYDNPNFEGNIITVINDNETGNKTYYAKWN